MAAIPTFDIQYAHQSFSIECFNKTWEYIEKDCNRSTEENLEMLHTAIASLWHWSQREDATAKNLSIGYWQVSRVYCLIKQPNNARTYGLLALKHSKDLPPFYRGYAYETLARAEMTTNNRVIMLTHLEKALEMLDLVNDPKDKQLLTKDLESIR